MTTPPSTTNGSDSRARVLPRATLLAGTSLLGAGWVVALTVGQTWPTVTRVLVDLGLAAVVSVPILNVVAIMTVEWQRRGRLFVLAAAAVLLMLVANVFWWT
ncbi:MAG TPA: hypothetical protein VMM93_14160 [Vicinamibacterales bacterium]|nr:hypothetical protein [Vicinamibacterales bacterium]